MPPGAVELSGRTYIRNAKGNLDDVEFIRDQDLMRDQLVREVFSAAQLVNQVIRDFKTKAFTDVQAFLDLIDEKYGAKVGGDKGNVTLATYDGQIRIQIQVADLIRFESAPLQACRKLLEECTSEWLEGSRAELRQIVMNAFRTNQAGEMSRGALLGLLRYDIKDDRWVRAMEALKDSIQVDATKAYIRVHQKSGADGPWIGLSLDAATA